MIEKITGMELDRNELQEHNDLLLKGIPESVEDLGSVALAHPQVQRIQASRHHSH